MTKVFKLPKPILQDIQSVYKGFSHPACSQDCGEHCRTQNPNDKPFCCDPTFAIPALYNTEYKQLEQLTDLWFSAENTVKIDSLPDGMSLHRCQGPQLCQRGYRSISCRSFPFFPYITSDYEFLGLAVEWEFQEVCWLANHLLLVEQTFRDEFINTYDKLFVQYQDVFDNYHEHSIRCRNAHLSLGKKVKVLHRNGKNYWVDANTEVKKAVK